MVYQQKITVLSGKSTDLVKITRRIKQIVEKAGIRSGIVAVVTLHTTTGITVNEGLDCLESDIGAFMRKIVPDDDSYAHAHWLPTYGRTSANAVSHLRSLLTGNHCVFPVCEGKMLLGAAQDIYLAEYDGPQSREISVSVIGD